MSSHCLTQPTAVHHTKAHSPCLFFMHSKDSVCLIKDDMMIAVEISMNYTSRILRTTALRLELEGDEFRDL